MGIFGKIWDFLWEKFEPRPDTRSEKQKKAEKRLIGKRYIKKLEEEATMEKRVYGFLQTVTDFLNKNEYEKAKKFFKKNNRAFLGLLEKKYKDIFETIDRKYGQNLTPEEKRIGTIVGGIRLIFIDAYTLFSENRMKSVIIKKIEQAKGELRKLDRELEKELARAAA